MRVIQPKKAMPVSKKTTMNGKLIAGMVVVSVASLFLLQHSVSGNLMNIGQVKGSVSEVSELPAQEPVVATTELRELTGADFRSIYSSTLPGYPNVRQFTTPPTITGDDQADARIRALAEKRGFVLTGIPSAALVKTDEPLLKGSSDDLMQPLAFADWKQLQKSAKSDNIPLELFSAYRSPERQRELFNERLFARGVTTAQIARGNADSAVDATLSMTALPGYSRHHTGFTADFTCGDGTTIFGASICYQWLKKFNFLHAKEHGWIPSYPEGAGVQGPEPEPWEFVWVGKSKLVQ